MRGLARTFVKRSSIRPSRYEEGISLPSAHSQFLEQPIIQDSVIRNLEAARNLSPHFRKQHPKIPWRGIMAMRNVLVHEYFGVDLPIDWKVVSRRIPPLKLQILSILRKLDR
jgi:uncharacterized protein with HEPN domain